MATFIDSYALEIYGNVPLGSGLIQGPRAKVTLNPSAPCGYILFWDSLSPVDEDKNGMIFMNLPISLLASILDFLRHTQPGALRIVLFEGHAVLGMEGFQQIGEG